MKRTQNPLYASKPPQFACLRTYVPLMVANERKTAYRGMNNGTYVRTSSQKAMQTWYNGTYVRYISHKAIQVGGITETYSPSFDLASPAMISSSTGFDVER
jgi:hypothetical protein